MNSEPSFPVADAPEQSQLALWRFFLPENKRGFSYTLDLWESIPRFVLCKERSTTHISLERPFRVNDQQWFATLRAALLETNGKPVPVFPGFREQLIFAVLIELAAHQFRDIPGCSVPTIVVQRDTQQFVALTTSIHAIQTKLAQYHHEMTYDSIREGLDVLSLATFSISNRPFTKRHPQKQGDFTASAMPYLSYTAYQPKPNRTSCLYRITLNPIASNSILTTQCWPINNALVLSLTQPLAIWIATRLSHCYRQAPTLARFGTKINPYSLSLNAVRLESGINLNTRVRDTVKRVRNALQELKSADILLDWTETPYHATATVGRPKLVDVVWHLTTSFAWGDSIAACNRLMAERRVTHPEHLRDSLLKPANP